MAREDFDLGDNYDPFVPVVKSTDEKGHSTYYRLRVPDDWGGRIAELVESGKVPDYRSVSDFIRDAIFHRMEFWSRNQVNQDPELKTLLARERSLIRMRRRNQLIESRDDFVKNLDALAEGMAREADWKALFHEMNHLEDEAREAFSDPHLERVLERINYWRKRSDRF